MSILGVKFCADVKEVFASEEKMKDYWEANCVGIWDATDCAQRLVWTIFKKRFQTELPSINPVSVDTVAIIPDVLAELDYNLASQILLNIQKPIHFSLPVADLNAKLAKLIAALKANTGAPDPTAPKAKYASVDQSAQTWFSDYNEALGLLKSSKIFETFTSTPTSFRVSPMGKTPAMSDSKNLSMLSLPGSNLLKPKEGCFILHITWGDSAIPDLMPEPDGTIRVSNIEYPFVSKSGGDILRKSLFSRRVLVDIAKNWNDSIVNYIPRLNSLTLIHTIPDDSKITELGNAIGTYLAKRDL